jgi:hypothetical protein
MSTQPTLALGAVDALQHRGKNAGIESFCRTAEKTALLTSRLVQTIRAGKNHPHLIETGPAYPYAVKTRPEVIVQIHLAFHPPKIKLAGPSDQRFPLPSGNSQEPFAVIHRQAIWLIETRRGLSRPGCCGDLE